MLSALTALAKRLPPATFVVLAYASTWLFRVPLAASSAGFLPVHVLRGCQFVGDFGPLLAANIIVVITEGRSGLQALLGRLLLWKVSAV